MGKMAAITPKDVDYGFRLTGISQFIALNDNVIETAKNLINKGEYTIILIDERLLNDDEKRNEIEKLQEDFHGIISIIPAPAETEGVGYDIVDTLISRAIGYQVRLKK